MMRAVICTGSVAVVLACASGNPTTSTLTSGRCGIQVSAAADVAIPTLSGSVRLIGHPDDQIVDRGFRPGGIATFTVDCEARCVVVQGSGRDPTTGRTVRFEGAGDLEPGEFVRVRMTRKTGTSNAAAEARRRGCVTGL